MTMVMAAVVTPAVIAPAIVVPAAPAPVVVATPVVIAPVAVDIVPVAVPGAAAIPIHVGALLVRLGCDRLRLRNDLAALAIIGGCRGSREAHGQRDCGEDLLVHNGTSA